MGLIEERRLQSQQCMYFISPIVSDLLERELIPQERFRAVRDGAQILFETWNPVRAPENWEQTVELHRLSLEAKLPHPLEMTTVWMADKLMFDQAKTAKRHCEEALEVVASPRLFDRLSIAQLTLGNGDEAAKTLRRR